MTGMPENPDGGRAPADARPAARVDDVDRPRSGPVAELALVAAGLGVVIYLLGFVDATATGRTVVGPLLLGGGLLAGSVALPTVRAGVLAPAAAVTTAGALYLLQTVVNGNATTVAIGAVVLALLEAAATSGATLLDAGVVRAPRPRRKDAAPPYAPFLQPGSPQFPGQQYPGQQYPGQPYPGSYAGQPGEPGDQYAGEHAYAQYARYGTPYGVPGYPPPPPHGVAGHGAYGRPETPAAGLPATDRSTSVTATGGHRPVGPAPSGDRGVEGSGASHALTPADASTIGGHPVVPGAPAPDRPARGDDDRTRAIPTVQDEQ